MRCFNLQHELWAARRAFCQAQELSSNTTLIGYLNVGELKVTACNVHVFGIVTYSEDRL